MSKESTSSYSGVGFTTLLGLLFIGLKLGNVITWSWWWVLLPLYGFWVLVLLFFLFTLGMIGIAKIFKV
jgi:hypothetical protein